MNKTILTLFIIFSSIAASAQFFVPRLGVTFNHNTHSVTSANDGRVYHAKAGVGFIGGIGYNAKLGERVSFQPEVYYILRNYRLKYVDSLNTSTGPTPAYKVNNSSDTYRIGYIEIPLLFKFKFLKDRLFFTFGPFLSIGLGGGHDYTYIQTGLSTRSGTDRIIFGPAPTGNNTNRSFDRRDDIGFQPGLGVVILKKLQLECRWDYGTKNQLKSASSRNETLIFMASYPLNLVSEDE
jgi:hypothetical protein